MRTIHRYTLTITNEQLLSLPVDAVLLDVADHPGALGWRLDGEPNPTLDLWALVDPTMPMVKRAIHVIGTGAPVPEHAVRGYVGTVVSKVRDRRAVWHVFDGGERAAS